jgi:Ca2+-binding RTX toxin-like protein
MGVDDRETLNATAGGALLSGTAGDDSLTGGPDGDHIIGHDGDDTLEGAGGDDHLKGQAGDDWLLGGAGDDHLKGGAGGDVLVGGTGDDTLVGGGGRDRFLYQAGDADGATDRIVGFQQGPGRDVIDLTEVLSGATAATIGDYIQVLETKGGTVLAIDADGGGDGYDDLFIDIRGLQIRGIADLQQLIADGNLVVSDTFAWSPGDGDKTIDGGPGDDTVIIDAPDTATGDVTVTPNPDGTISVQVGGETLTLDNVEEITINGSDGDDTIRSSAAPATTSWTSRV